MNASLHAVFDPDGLKKAFRFFRYAYVNRLRWFWVCVLTPTLHAALLGLRIFHEDPWQTTASVPIYYGHNRFFPACWQRTVRTNCVCRCDHSGPQEGSWDPARNLAHYLCRKCNLRVERTLR